MISFHKKKSGNNNNNDDDNSLSLLIPTGFLFVSPSAATVDVVAGAKKEWKKNRGRKKKRGKNFSSVYKSLKIKNV